jgi:hypothetical protein
MTRIGKKLFEITSVPFKDPKHLPIPKLPEEAPVEPVKEPVPVRKE